MILPRRAPSYNCHTRYTLSHTKILLALSCGAWYAYSMKNKNSRMERIKALRRIELEKLSAIKRSLWDDGFWIPKKK